jgi:hypothetical protein
MKTFFLHDKNRLPVTCVVTELKVSGVLFAVSTYNPIDIFSKRIARDVATGRLVTNGGSSVSSGKDVKVRILKAIISDTEMPTRTREAAKLWLKNPPKPKTKKTKAA